MRSLKRVLSFSYKKQREVLVVSKEGRIGPNKQLRNWVKKLEDSS